MRGYTLFEENFYKDNKDLLEFIRIKRYNDKSNNQNKKLVETKIKEFKNTSQNVPPSTTASLPKGFLPQINDSQEFKFRKRLVSPTYKLLTEVNEKFKSLGYRLSPTLPPASASSKFRDRLGGNQTLSLVEPKLNENFEDKKQEDISSSNEMTSKIYVETIFHEGTFRQSAKQRPKLDIWIPTVMEDDDFHSDFESIDHIINKSVINYEKSNLIETNDLQEDKSKKIELERTNTSVFSNSQSYKLTQKIKNTDYRYKLNKSSIDKEPTSDEIAQLQQQKSKVSNLPKNKVNNSILFFSENQVRSKTDLADTYRFTKIDKNTINRVAMRPVRQNNLASNLMEECEQKMDDSKIETQVNNNEEQKIDEAKKEQQSADQSRSTSELININEAAKLRSYITQIDSPAKLRYSKRVREPLKQYKFGFGLSNSSDALSQQDLLKTVTDMTTNINNKLSSTYKNGITNSQDLKQQINSQKQNYQQRSSISLYGNNKTSNFSPVSLLTSNNNNQNMPTLTLVKNNNPNKFSKGYYY